jgi:methionine-rich copper-binding protein CopC
MRPRSVVAMFAALVALFGAAASAAAHAIILKAEPAAGSSVAGPKVGILLQYNSRIDAQRSRLVLDLPDGSKRPLTILPQPSLDVLAATADNVPPGGYRLRWQVLSTDGHITRGEVPFRVTAP